MATNINKDGCFVNEILDVEAPISLELKNYLGWMNYALELLEEKFGNSSFWYSEVDYCIIGGKE